MLPLLFFQGSYARCSKLITFFRSVKKEQGIAIRSPKLIAGDEVKDCFFYSTFLFRFFFLVHVSLFGSHHHVNNTQFSGFAPPFAQPVSNSISCSKVPEKQNEPKEGLKTDSDSQTRSNTDDTTPFSLAQIKLHQLLSNNDFKEKNLFFFLAFVSHFFFVSRAHCVNGTSLVSFPLFFFFFQEKGGPPSSSAVSVVYTEGWDGG